LQCGRDISCERVVNGKRIFGKPRTNSNFFGPTVALASRPLLFRNGWLQYRGMKSETQEISELVNRARAREQEGQTAVVKRKSRSTQRGGSAGCGALETQKNAARASHSSRILRVHPVHRFHRARRWGARFGSAPPGSGFRRTLQAHDSKNPEPTATAIRPAAQSRHKEELSEEAATPGQPARAKRVLGNPSGNSPSRIAGHRQPCRNAPAGIQDNSRLNVSTLR
jgi:hypothetical protein